MSVLFKRSFMQILRHVLMQLFKLALITFLLLCYFKSGGKGFFVKAITIY